ncbi:hypothetical protein P255_02668 [Acinetobacter brisouii CIP 110357]|uniref:Uncharacterized protein n=1 Tax=Acinetobacter brisouii CIP 110357 TaxID=1341683 RepID=V2UNE7_9GAMM|nr:hypothetical protein [Acinetobacter brisouii]ENV48911.1 hypothetical protein F954_00051 [Acinetobacter brisouii ANC 4119]ESK50170.1 hypothetical protein P255_02668 [Acinetobacter brisouii CIP 110357]
MGFINAEITEQDRLDYGTDDYAIPYFKSAENWTIDREKKMFLFRYWKGHELGVDTHISIWVFGINGGLLKFTKEILEYKKIEDGHYYSKQKLTDLQIIKEVNVDRQQLLQYIVEAMEVCKERGLFSSMKSYDLVVELSEVL